MKRNSKRTRKIRNSVIICVLSAILLTVSTYAWFIGMKTVKVNPFEIKIATTEGLMLSLDGKTWTTELNTLTEMDADENNNQAYDGNTNQWLTGTGEGLIPMSTVGDINSTSRLRLFEKGSLTTTAGGYRLLASEVNNHLDDDGQDVGKEAAGYVAFDLFIRNMSGEAYYSEDNVENEEAIYLTYDSDVSVGTSGTQNTGIENSVRVAFAQIGRVENQEYSSEEGAEYDVATVTGISCEPTDDAVTGICRTATIWEPNDTNHITNATNWYGKSCLKRTGSASGFTYADTDNACSTVSNGNAYETYAISREIAIGDYVDIYDGANYNKYTSNTVEPTAYAAYHTAKTTDEDFDASAYKLVAVDTFTETERNATGNARNVFMTLAPNSITKVRVYVYIEGQDIDNYDFAQLGKSIQVNFGFTKERYTTDDYDDEPVTVIPGAENVTKVPYAPTTGVTVSNPVLEGVTIVWDAETNAFYHHEDDTVTTFKFTETKGETEQEATATYAEGKWTFTGTIQPEAAG